MDLTSSNIVRSLPPVVAGLLLGVAGWMGAEHRQADEQDYLPQLVVRPSSAEVISTRARALTPDEVLSGRYQVDATVTKLGLELKPKDWPSSRAELEEARGMTTVRGAVPRATLSVSVKGSESTQAELLELPKKTKLPSAQGQTRLVPGRHELLVQAEGYIPERLSVNLLPGERKEVTVEMQAIPGLPTGLPGALPSNLPATPPAPSLPSRPSAPSSAVRPSRPAYTPPAYSPPAYTPSVYRPTPPKPRYQPPVSRPAPAPRFTPVAPAPKPAAPNPVPMFTPIGN